jgi:hypothetical protein
LKDDPNNFTVSFHCDAPSQNSHYAAIVSTVPV